MSRYPYPVLTESESSYQDNIKFEISYVRSVCLSDCITFEFNIVMNSIVIKELMDANNAKMIMKVQTGFYSKIYDVTVTDGNFKCTLESSNIEDNDILKFVCYVVAEKEFVLNHSDEMLDIYDEDYTVKIRKKDVLAISNMESLTYNASNNDFINFVVSEEQSGKGFKVGYGDNFIKVTIGPELNVAYGKIKNNKKDVCAIFDSHLVFEVFVHTLIDLVQQYEEFKECEWYLLFEQVFMQTGEYESFENFIIDVKDDDIINMDIIYEMAHKMINNQIENSLISLSKYEEV